MNNDQEHLRLLSIFHYIVAGIIGLFACFPIVHLVLGIAIVTGRLPTRPNQEGVPPAVGWLFIVLAGLMIVAGWALVAALVVAGRSLARHTNYMLCLVVAAIECSFIPFGTVLGVLTIIVLLRPSVKQRFGRESDSAP
jgi:hypothetical protein